MNKKQVTLHENLPIIEVANPLLLDTLLSDKRTAHLILKRLDQQVAIVAPGKFEALLLRLKKLGHLPPLVFLSGTNSPDASHRRIVSIDTPSIFAASPILMNLFSISTDSTRYVEIIPDFC